MTTRAPGDRDDSSGFTLFEALVALALMGLILSALASVTAQWLPNWNRGLLRVQRNEQTAIALERLASDLSNALYVSPNGASRRPLFSGNELAVTFVRTALGPNSKPGLEIVRIGEIAEGPTLTLVRMRAPFVPLPTGDITVDPIPFADPVVLLRSPLRVSFAYAAADGVWRSAWQNNSELPGAVRIMVRNARDERTLAVSTAALVRAEMMPPEPDQSEEEPPKQPEPGTASEAGSASPRR